MTIDKEVLATVKVARTFIERGWTQGYLARDWEDEVVPPNSHEATCWCTLGALQAAASQIYEPAKAREVSQRAAGVVLRHLREYTGDGSMYTDEWNDADGRTAEEVEEMLDRVARELEEQSNVGVQS